jgi:hypothetical protein
MQQIDGNGASRADRRFGMLGQCQGNLQKAAGPDEIISKVRSQWIAPPRSASDAVSAFANQGVVDQRHDRTSRRQGFQHPAQGNPPQGLAVKTLALE